MASVNIDNKNIKLPDTVDNLSISIGVGGVTPSVSCSFGFSATSDVTLVNWALKPQSADRFKKVIIQTFDRDKVVNKTWTIGKAYVTGYQESEGGMGQASYTSVSLEGVLISGEIYKDEKTIIEVAGGTAEKNPGA